MKTDITIEETIDRYDTFRDEVAGKSVREMFEKLKLSAKEGEYVSNDTYFHALFLSEIMFSTTEKSLRIFSGCDIVRFLKALHSSFVECCRKIANNGGDVRIVSIIPDVEHFETCKNDLQEFFNELKNDVPEIKGKLYGLLKVLPRKLAESVRTGQNNTLSHYIVADNMVRIEEPHKILVKTDPASSIKAKVFFNAPKMANELIESFDKSYFKTL